MKSTEPLFRDQLATWAATCHPLLPLPLYDAIIEHLGRADAQGHTLCFDSPYREDLCADLWRWLASQPVDVCQAYAPSLAELVANGHAIL